MFPIDQIEPANAHDLSGELPHEPWYPVAKVRRTRLAVFAFRSDYRMLDDVCGFRRVQESVELVGH